MGKTKRHKLRQSIKLNPLGAVRQDDEDQELFNEGSVCSVRPIEALREQMQNPNVEEKLNGLQSLAILAGRRDKLAAICQSDVARIAAPLLCERDQAVRNAAAGALRNLSVCGPEVCEFLVDQDILTPLTVLLNEYTRDLLWVPSFDIHNQLDLRSDVFLQAINLLWNLCESTSVALDIFNQTLLLEGFIRCLDANVFGIEIAISVGQCLLVVSENNPKSWAVLNQHVHAFLQLSEIRDGYDHLYLATLSAGVISNVPALAASHTAKILKTLAATLSIEQNTVLTEAMSALENEDQSRKTPELEIKMDTFDDECEEAAVRRRREQELPTPSDIIVRNIGYVLDAQRVAAEVLTNLCSSDEAEWIDDEDDSEYESVADYDDRSDCSQPSLVFEDKLSVELTEAIKSMDLISTLWKRAQPLPNSIIYFLRENSISLLMKAKNLHVSILLCLQNLCNSLSSDDLGGVNAIYDVWVNLGQQVLKGPQDVSILEPATSLMRSALIHLKTKQELFTQMTENDLELILSGVENCTMAEIRANWLRMLGSLGCLLPEDLVKVIILFIVKTCQKEDDVWTISEGLDALMDIFEDNDWDLLVQDLNLVALTKGLEQLFKNKVRQQKRELKERYPAVQTVRLNFSRFIKHIEKISVRCDAQKK